MKKFIFSNIYSLLVNIFLLFFLLFAIQNSNDKKVIKIFNRETIELPISFILGTAFITGSLSGNFIFSILSFKKR
tara:strand:- start:155 stop:379 length:225 start_codon:yes stop_codon:yes gene_type:complete